MYPNYKNEPKVLLVKKLFINLNISDVVVAKDPRDERLILKRINNITKDSFFLVGDNEKESTDSRELGWINKKNIIGKIVMKIK